MIGFKNRPRTEWIIVHCTKTRPDQKDQWGQPYGYRALREKHLLFDIGYHWLIERNGVAIQCRPEHTPGNHCPGFNQSSVAICLVGGLGENGQPESNYTRDQWETLNQLVGALYRKYPKAKVSSHFPLSTRPNEWCPAFDARTWWNDRRYQERQRAKEQTQSEERDPQPSPVSGPEH